MARLTGGPANGHDIDLVPARSPLTVWVTLLDGRPQVLDMADPTAARDLLSRAHRNDDGEPGPGWHEYERDRSDPGIYRFVPPIDRR